MSITQMFTIAKRLFPEKTPYDLTPEERAQVMEIYRDYN